MVYVLPCAYGGEWSFRLVFDETGTATAAVVVFVDDVHARADLRTEFALTV